jgi:hypothetical protein
MASRGGNTLNKDFLGFLSVQLLFLDEPVEGLRVRFLYASGEREGSGLNGALELNGRTDARGRYFRRTPARVGVYRLEIEGQPEPAFITTVEDLDEPFVVPLPLGRPYFDLVDPDPPPPPSPDPVIIPSRPNGEYLSVRVLFLNEPVRDLELCFATTDGQKSATLRTDAHGRASLPGPVTGGQGFCEIEGQPRAAITTVEDPARPYVIVLPVGRPYFETHDFPDLGDDPFPPPPTLYFQLPARPDDGEGASSRDEPEEPRRSEAPETQGSGSGGLPRDMPTRGPVLPAQGYLSAQLMYYSRLQCEWLLLGHAQVTFTMGPHRFSEGTDQMGLAIVQQPVPKGVYTAEGTIKNLRANHSPSFKVPVPTVEDIEHPVVVKIPVD